ncbi:uncharacterized protein LOC132547443 [Ylistrum balloti]|uniref:uncharacterized protein LOC132547443 n=1 Tax=Ylistrum balloti TaxID=509963 RepID=UPI002905C470|nr:uncharacterized protein LOC132547443 [Ylistrum balloti]
MNMGREASLQLLYNEHLYYTKGQATVLKKKKVILKEKKIGEEFSFFKLADVQFQQEELCFLERDELEYKVPGPVQHLCGTAKKQFQRKRFHTLCVLTYDIQKKTSSLQRFYEESNSGEICIKKIATLKRRLDSILGPCFSWFVDTVEDVGYGPSIKLRLLITSQNLCLLDHKMQLLYFHQLDKDNPNITISYDNNRNVLEMNFKEICPCSPNFQSMKCIRVLTGLGEEIKSKVETILMGSLPPTGHIRNWRFDNLEVRSVIEDFEDVEEISPPTPHFQMHITLPPPCQHGQKSPVENDDSAQSDFIPELVSPLPRNPGLFRTQSMNGKCVNHVYQNEEFCKSHSRRAHEDGSYTCPFRDDRHNRLSSEFGDVNITAMRKHEYWFDVSFKRRSIDKIYSRLDENSTNLKEVWNPNTDCSLNIPIPAVNPTACGMEDDVYWNTDLCLCIQQVFESKLRKSELMEALDVTWEQLVALFIHLDVRTLHVKAKDWKDFADILGLPIRDIEIIQHFCYTYHEWPMFIILSYWMMLSRKRRETLPSCRHIELKKILQRLGRHDLLKILTTRNVNEHIQVAQEQESTHL